jgi:hypothetical protein
MKKEEKVEEPAIFEDAIITGILLSKGHKGEAWIREKS